MASCCECNEPFRGRQYNSEFCGYTCRRVFNNRRALRGAMLYDLQMLLRAPTAASSSETVSARIEALMRQWDQEDLKAGRKRSWKRASTVLTETHYLTAVPA